MSGRQGHDNSVSPVKREINRTSTDIDIDWRDPHARSAALQSLMAQFRRVQDWLQSEFDADALAGPPLAEPLGTVERIIEQHERGIGVVSKPPAPRKSERFNKADFNIDFDTGSVTCPSDITVPLTHDKKANFPAATCRECKVRASCLTEKNNRGRQVRLHPQEKWYRQMAGELSTSEGRAKRRERIPVEHALARVGMIQGQRARYRGLEKNQFDLERTAVVNNCYILGAILQRAA